MGLPKPNETSTSKETMDATSSGAKRKRGITSMHRIVKNKNTGKKLVVEYTPKGKPYGKVASELASYIGVLARTTVPISVESWPKVEKDLKNKIWESVEAAFVLAPKSRKMVLTSASNRWRQFKSDLTRKYIMPFKDEAEALKNPPEDYGFIKQQHWKQFVNGRLTKEFQILHNEQKERRAKFQQPHRMSQKGYVGLEAESRKTMPEDELDGSLLCKKACKDRKGQAAKIDLLTKEHSEHSDHSEHAEHSEHAKYAERGEHSEHTEQSEHAEPSEHAEHSEHLEHPKHSEHPEHSEHSEHSEHFDVSLLSKNNDVLTMALGAPEDSGRVRGVGGFFKPNVPQAQFDREYILDEVRKMIEQQRAWYEAKIAELEAKINGNIRTTPISLSTPVPNRSEKASCSGKKKNVLEDYAINFEELTVVGKRDTIKFERP